MKKNLLTLTALIILVLIFLTWKLWVPKEKQSPVKQEQELKEIKIAMGFIPNVQFAPFYVAQEKGYFEKQGLKVDFDYGMETDLITLLGKDELSFVVGSGDQVILAANKGLPVIMFVSWYKKFPVCLVSLEEKNIGKPADLVGKSVGIPAQVGASFIGWQAFLKKANLDPQKTNLKTIGYTQVESLTQEVVQAAVCYSMNEPVRLESLGYKINKIEFSDYANLPSNGLLTNKKTLQENPELVQAIAAAFFKGLEETINNPDEAFEISKKYIPEMKDEDLQKKVLLACLPFWNEKPLGTLEKEVWQKAVDLMAEFGMVKKDLEVEKLFDYRFAER